MRISTPITGVDSSSPTTPNSAPPITSANITQNGLSPIESPSTLGESTHASKPCTSVSSTAASSAVVGLRKSATHTMGTRPITGPT